MNRDQGKGRIDDIKGRVKGAAGALTGNKKLEGEGLVDRVKGAVREGIGNLEEAIEKGSRKNGSDDRDTK